MPQNGEVNQKFGVYKCVCCGFEIVITAGATFPDWPNHQKLTTFWKPVMDGEVSRPTGKKSESDTAA